MLVNGWTPRLVDFLGGLEFFVGGFMRRKGRSLLLAMEGGVWEDERRLQHGFVVLKGAAYRL